MRLSGYTYTARNGESWDQIALGIYGDERYAAELMTANPEQKGMIFAGGEVIKLPTLTVGTNGGGQAIGKAPWKE